MRNDYQKEQVELRNLLLDLTNFEPVPVFEYVQQIRQALQADCIQNFSDFISTIKSVLRRIVPPETLLPAKLQTDSFLPIQSQDQVNFSPISKFKISKKNSNNKAQTVSLFSNINNLIQKLNKKKDIVLKAIEGQEKLKKAQREINKYDERLKVFYQIKINIEGLIKLYTDYCSDLQNSSLDEEYRKSLIEGRPIMFGIGFQPVYLKREKADLILGGKSIAGPSHIVVRVDDIYFKRDPHGTSIEFAIDNFNKTLNGQGSTPTTLVKIFNGQEVVLLQASKAVSGPLLHYVLGCDLVSVSFPLNFKNFRECPIRNSAAYVRNQDKLFYVNFITQKFEEVFISKKALKEIDELFNPTEKFQPLSHEQIQEINRITGHHRDLGDVEALVSLKSFSAQIASSLAMHPGDGKADNIILADGLAGDHKKGELVLIDQDVGLVDPFILLKNGNHLPAVKNILYCWETLMKQPFDLELREHLKRQSPATIVLQWLLNCYIQNQEYQKLLEEGVLSFEEYEKLKLPIEFVRGIVGKIYLDVQKIVEWCRGEGVTHKELFEFVDPHLYLFYEYIKTLNPDPREAYFFAFNKADDVENLNIPGLGREELYRYQNKFYDYEDKRAEAVTVMVTELMSVIQFSDLIGSSLILGEEPPALQFLKLLKSFPNLKEMIFKDNDFLTDECIHKLSPWPQSLQKLTLIRCPNVTSKGVEEIIFYASNLELMIEDCAGLATKVWPFELVRNRKLTWKLTDGYFLSYPRNLLNAENHHPIHQVVRAGSLEAVKIILASGGSLLDVNAEGETPFFEALRCHDPERIFLALLQMKTPINLEKKRHLDAVTLFQYVAQSGRLIILQKLFRMEKNSEKREQLLTEEDVHKQTVLHHAALGGNKFVVEWLLEQGANPHHVSLNGTAILIAAQHNFIHIVQAFLKHKPNLINNAMGRSDLNSEMQKYLIACHSLLEMHGNLACISLPILVAEGRHALKERDLDDNARMLARLGKEAIFKENIKEAYQYFLQALNLQPDNRSYKIQLGQLAYSIADFEMAKRLLCEAFSKNDARVKFVINTKLSCEVLKNLLGLEKQKIIYSLDQVSTLALEIEDSQEETQKYKPHPYFMKLLNSWFEKFFIKDRSSDSKKMISSLKAELPIAFTPFLDNFLKEKNIAVSSQLYGRDAEIMTITNLFSEVCEGGSVFLLISGVAGLGKTNLIKTALEPAALKRGFYVTGKCDQIVRHPFAAIGEALNALVKILLKNELQLTYWKEKINSALSPNTHLMVKFIPSLQKIIGYSGKSEFNSPTQNEAFLFEQLFIKFIQLFNSQQHPLVIFLDDLQWADIESLGLLQQLLLSDRATNRYLFVVGSVRSNEWNEDHPLGKMVSLLKNNEKIIVNLELKKLTKAQIEELVMGVLNWPSDKNPELLEALSEKIFKDTDGNPFYAQQLLLAMQTNQYLVYEKSKGSWQLNESRKHLVPLSIAEILVGRLKDLSETQKIVISYAASLGNAFSLKTLALVLDKSIPDIHETLQGIITAGLIFETDSELQQYQFVHDTVQEKAQTLDLVSEQTLCEQHFVIGNRLLSRSSEFINEEDVLIAMVHINKSLNFLEKTLPFDQKLFFARKNLIAGLKSKETTAFSSANQFLGTGISLLENQKNNWIEHYDLLFNLYKAGIECAYLTGQHERAEALFDIAIQNARDPVEKAELYSYKLDSHSRRGEFVRALEAGKAGLKILDVEVDVDNKVQQFLVLLPNLAKLLADIRNEKIQWMKASTFETAVDPHEMMVTTLYSKMREVAILDKKPELYAALGIKTANFILQQKNPNPKFVGSVFSTLAVLLAHLKLFDKARIYDEASLEFIEKHGLIEAMPVAFCVSPTFIQFGYQPLPKLIDNLKRSHEASLRTGQLAYANYTSGIIIVYSAIILPIQEVLELHEKYSSFMHRSQFQIILLGSNLLKSAAMSLTDISSYSAPPPLERWVNLVKEPGNSIILMTYSYLFMVLCIQGYFKQLIQFSKVIKKEIKSADGLPVFLMKFYAYLSSLKLGDATENPLCSEKKMLKTLEENVRNSQQFTHVFNLALAEKSALKFRRAKNRSQEELEKIETYYQDSIQSAKEFNWLAGCALATEFFAYFYQEIGENQKASEQWFIAMDLYRKYGATAKVSNMQEKIKSFNFSSSRLWSSGSKSPTIRKTGLLLGRNSKDAVTHHGERNSAGENFSSIEEPSVSAPPPTTMNTPTRSRSNRVAVLFRPRTSDSEVTLVSSDSNELSVAESSTEHGSEQSNIK